MLYMENINKVTNAPKDYFGYINNRYSLSYEETLKNLENIENFVKFYVNDVGVVDIIDTMIYEARIEILDKMVKEFPVVRVRSSENPPENAIFIHRDGSNMYADYLYYYDKENSKIYEERVSLGD